jgi:FkbM family methyltransferase
MKFYVPFDVNVYNNFVHDNNTRGLQTLYNLNSESLVIDAGGYNGEFTETIHAKYNCSVHIFEPIKSMFDALESKFSSNPKIIVNQLGLSNSTRDDIIYLDNDGSSLYGTGDSETIQCIDVSKYLQLNKIQLVDLFKLNIEGAEYDVIERLIDQKQLTTIKNLQVQFHRFIPDCDIRRANIHKQLSKTHTLTWNYDWIWESWAIIE